MRFVIDAQLPPALARWLQAKGHEALAVREIGLRDSADPDIWAWVLPRDAIIVTKDEDFPALAASRPDGPIVLWVRTGNLVNRVLLARFESAWAEIEGHLESGVRVVELR